MISLAVVIPIGKKKVTPFQAGNPDSIRISKITLAQPKAFSSSKGRRTRVREACLRHALASLLLRRSTLTA